MSSSVIISENLTKFYKKELGVAELDLEVNKGEIFGYLGPNGAGKTTTIRLFLDFIHPTTGSVQIFGWDAHTHSQNIRQRIGYLPGELELYGNLTGSEFLTYLANLRGGVDWNYVENLAIRFKSDLSRPLKSLSHGNKQKIGLIQAFMHRPELLILDEPTIGLDPIIQQEFYSLVSEVKAEGCTVFLSSHILPEVERICDRVAIIREGRLVDVEKISEMKIKRLHHFEVHFGEKVLEESFNQVEGVVETRMDDNILYCKVKGSPDSLIKVLAHYKVNNIVCHEPSLEEVFLTYYQTEEKL